jgi:hypothetical protein
MIDIAVAAARYLNKTYPTACWSLGESGAYRDLKWGAPAVLKPTAEEFEAGLAVEYALDLQTEYKRQRAREYPPIEDYIDGVVKGDQAQVQAYIDACLAVKAKYPKPE